VIPAGEYGAGTVMVWDYGTYENVRTDAMSTCLKNGRIEIFLHGKKLTGIFVLIKIKMGWLFFKKDDQYSSTENIIKIQTCSALTGRTIEEITAQESGKPCRGCL